MALHAVHLAEAVMQQHIGRARRIGARIIADDGIEAERRLDRRRSRTNRSRKSPAERGEEVEHVALAFESRAGAIDRRIFRRGTIAAASRPRPARRFGGVSCATRAQNVRERIEPRRIGVEPFRIPRREFRDLGLRAACTDLQIAAVVERQKIREFSRNDAQPVTGKIEIADDRRLEQRNRVGRDRIAEAGMKLLASPRSRRPCRGASSTKVLSPAAPR